MNLAGGAYLIVSYYVLTNSPSESINFIRLLQSFELRSMSIFLKSSMTKGSIGLDTRLFFLNAFEFEVVLKPWEPPVVVITVTILFELVVDGPDLEYEEGMLKSEDYVNWPNPSLPWVVVYC